MNTKQLIEDWWNNLSDEKRQKLLNIYDIPKLEYKYIKEIYQLEVMDKI